MTENTELIESPLGKGISAFTNVKAFADAQRMAKAISESNIVPQNYQHNIPNCLVAMEMANRIGISPIMVMQNLDIIQGKPSWRSSFIIAALNSCGRFTPLRFEWSGERTSDDFGCRAIAKDLSDGSKVIGTKINWTMVKAEGWLDKKGSKWATMPELMFQYRAAAFFGRLYAPDILTGMHSVEENMDISSPSMKQSMIEMNHAELKEYYESHNFILEDVDREHIERIIEEKEALSFDKAMKALKSKIEKDE